MYSVPPDVPAPSADKAVKAVRSTLVSRNVTIAGHRTSVRLEPEMWSGLSEICRRERASLHEICTAVSQRKSDNTSLTAAIRVFVMTYYRAAATDDGHVKASHGYGLAMIPANTSPVQTASMHTVSASTHTAPQISMSAPVSMGAPRLSSPFMMGVPRVSNGGFR